MSSLTSKINVKNISLIISLLFVGFFLSSPVWAEGQCLTLPSEMYAQQERDKELSKEKEIEEKRQQKEMETQVRKEAIAEFFREKNKNLEVDRAENYAHYVLEAGSQFGVDPFIIAAIIIKESKARHSARSRVAYGLMQINWRVHKQNIAKAFSHIKTLSDMMKPKNNIIVGTYIFSCYLNSSEGDIIRALSRYYGGKSERYVRGIFSYRQELDNRFAQKINLLIEGAYGDM